MLVAPALTHSSLPRAPATAVSAPSAATSSATAPAPPPPPRRRVTYVIPPISTHAPPPRLQLPPQGVPRHGKPGPLLIREPIDTLADQNGHGTVPSPTSPGSLVFSSRKRQYGLRHTSPARHRLGVDCLALDTSTSLVGHAGPGGILYSGGRDGMLFAWDLHLRSSLRQRRRPPNHAIKGAGKRWDLLTGWGDDDDDEEEEDVLLDGDVLGDVSGATRRRRSTIDDPFPAERQWEIELDDAEDVPVSRSSSDCGSDLTELHPHRTPTSVNARRHIRTG
jgi:WD repeat-containing protein 48